jgi:MATE family, multidrug efflux pump
MPAIASTLSARPAQSLGEHISRTLKLALPVMLARIGVVVMVTVAQAMTGHAGADEQAYFSIAFSPQMMMVVIGIGLMAGITVVSAQADGAGRSVECGRIWRLGLVAALLLGLAYAVALLWGAELLSLTGQEPDVAIEGGRVLLMFAPGMPAVLMFVGTSAFLESIGKTRPGLVVSLGSNLVNLLLCWLLIFGHWGLPAMGAAGAALAISITRWVMLIAIAGYALAMRDHERYGVHAPLAGHYHRIKTLLSVGAPLALATGLESSAFTTATIFAGWLGKAPLAAFQSILNLTALVFMLAIGVSTATSVRVANAVGRQDQQGIGRAGWVGAGLIILTTLTIGALIWLTREAIAAFYSDDAEVQALIIGTLALATWWFVVFDGLQAVLVGATRGVADVIVPTLTQGLAFWGVAIPLAFYLGLNSGAGVDGLFIGLGASLIAASLFLGLRFRVLSRRVIRPI